MTKSVLNCWVCDSQPEYKRVIFEGKPAYLYRCAKCDIESWIWKQRTKKLAKGEWNGNQRRKVTRLIS